MSGTDRRTAAACPRPAARDSLRTPVRVVELDLDEPGELRSPGGLGAGDPAGRVLALVRLHGHPLGLVTATGAAGESAALRRALVDAAHRELRVPALSTATPAARPGRVGRARVPAGPVTVSVVVATHNRVGLLRLCLDSLLRNGYPHFEVIVVDNAPADDAAERLIRDRYRGRVRYLREPVAGLARAHNTGLAAATGEITAFTDDDTLADPGWIEALAQTFAEDERIGCVTGLILPAELETPAQVALEHQGCFAKGFAARTWTLADRHTDPLFPFAAGRFGSGANMAFRTARLRALGGFDPATGTGTPARGGDDLLAFFRILVAGQALAYAPDAIVWHRHRRTMDAVPAQAFGYGAGFGAYLTAALHHEPAMLPALLRRLPGGLRYAAHRARTRPDPGGAAGRCPTWRLARLELQGLLYGPVGYARSVRRARAGARVTG
ncbi:MULTISPECIES: glycosyltransferase [unclassified Kitasatospora]|uniref:glycosyltransferase family 2 protein n=1 Tax=unclassified Kitasatospora TaxID=2633591 RepID=UPI0033DA7A75